MPNPEERLQVRRFRRADGHDIRLYCRVVKSRCTPTCRFTLYEDHAGCRWFEVSFPRESYLEPLSAASFEEQVAQELLVLGLNKYSG